MRMMMKIPRLFQRKWIAVTLFALGAVTVRAESSLQEEVPQEIKNRYMQLLQQALSPMPQPPSTRFGGRLRHCMVSLAD